MTTPTLGHDYEDSWSYSDDKVYRWSYERRWGEGPALCWVGLNPGTGDSDGGRRPTLAKVCRWAEAADLHAVVVVNLFAYRSTDPKQLRRVDDPVGPGNDEVIEEHAASAGVTLAAWGAGGRLYDRGATIASLLLDPVCLGTTKHGEPRHPLYVPQKAMFTPYRQRPTGAT